MRWYEAARLQAPEERDQRRSLLRRELQPEYVTLHRARLHVRRLESRRLEGVLEARRIEHLLEGGQRSVVEVAPAYDTPLSDGTLYTSCLSVSSAPVPDPSDGHAHDVEEREVLGRRREALGEGEAVVGVKGRRVAVDAALTLEDRAPRWNARVGQMRIRRRLQRIDVARQRIPMSRPESGPARGAPRRGEGDAARNQRGRYM